MLSRSNWMSIEVARSYVDHPFYFQRKREALAAEGIGAVDFVRHSRRGFDINVEDVTPGT
jgi:hypothetical protein